MVGGDNYKEDLVGVADLHSKILDAPIGLHFRAVFIEIWTNKRLAPLPHLGLAPFRLEILDPPLLNSVTSVGCCNVSCLHLTTLL